MTRWFVAATTANDRSKSLRARRLAIEKLEARELLSATPVAADASAFSANLFDVVGKAEPDQWYLGFGQPYVAYRRPAAGRRRQGEGQPRLRVGHDDRRRRHLVRHLGQRLDDLADGRQHADRRYGDERRRGPVQPVPGRARFPEAAVGRLASAHHAPLQRQDRRGGRHYAQRPAGELDDGHPLGRRHEQGSDLRRAGLDDDRDLLLCVRREIGRLSGLEALVPVR